MKKNCLLALFVLFNVTSIIAQNVDYSPLHNSSTFNRSLNINLPVRSLQGQGGVSAAGGATYSMSITIPPGTNGAIPSVSLDYNSQRGTGIIGMGWGLSGLSYISRATGTAYHDGSAQPIDLDLNDRFVLDGTRMVLKSGTYGTDGSTYGTEMDNFATITAKGTI